MKKISIIIAICLLAVSGYGRYVRPSDDKPPYDVKIIPTQTPDSTGLFKVSVEVDSDKPLGKLKFTFGATKHVQVSEPFEFEVDLGELTQKTYEFEFSPKEFKNFTVMVYVVGDNRINVDKHFYVIEDKKFTPYRIVPKEYFEKLEAEKERKRNKFILDIDTLSQEFLNTEITMELSKLSKKRYNDINNILKDLPEYSGQRKCSTKISVDEYITLKKERIGDGEIIDLPELIAPYLLRGKSRKEYLDIKVTKDTTQPTYYIEHFKVEERNESNKREDGINLDSLHILEQFPLLDKSTEAYYIDKNVYRRERGEYTFKKEVPNANIGELWQQQHDSVDALPDNHPVEVCVKLKSNDQLPILEQYVDSMTIEIVEFVYHVFVKKEDIEKLREADIFVQLRRLPSCFHYPPSKKN